MNEKLQQSLSELERLISTQKDCVIVGYPEASYMHGMLNGMILAHSIFDKSTPNFYSKPRRRKGPAVRHKIVKRNYPRLIIK